MSNLKNNLQLEVTIASEVLPCSISLASLDAQLNVKVLNCISLYYIYIPRFIIKALIIVNQT